MAFHQNDQNNYIRTYPFYSLSFLIFRVYYNILVKFYSIYYNFLLYLHCDTKVFSTLFYLFIYNYFLFFFLRHLHTLIFRIYEEIKI